MGKKESKKKMKSEQTSKAASVQEENTLSVEDQYKADLEQEKDKFLRLFAEFENYKRRTSKERLALFSTASQDVIQSLLPVLDDFDRALLEMSKHQENDLSKGVELIKNKFQSTLEQKGLSVVEVNKGDLFNADNHEAVTQIPAPNEDLKGKICIRSSGNIYNQSLVAGMLARSEPADVEAWAKGVVANMARDPQGGDRDHPVILRSFQ